MKDGIRESLSALMDGEADELELRRVLARLDEDEELKEQWHRYHVIQSVIRQQHDALTDDVLDTDLSARISAAISEEAVVPFQTGQHTA